MKNQKVMLMTKQFNQIVLEKLVPRDVEELSALFHEIYQAEAKRQGDVRHKDSYSELPERIKEFDRVLARYVLKRDEEISELTRLEMLDWAHSEAKRLRSKLYEKDLSPIDGCLVFWKQNKASGFVMRRKSKAFATKRKVKVNV
jgi:hypothetical protein